MASVLLTNIAEPVLSFFCLLENGIITSMLLGEEWSHFAHQRKALRVSKPHVGSAARIFFSCHIDMEFPSFYVWYTALVSFPVDFSGPSGLV
jgi:hypothetical protein